MNSRKLAAEGAGGNPACPREEIGVMTWLISLHHRVKRVSVWVSRFNRSLVVLFLGLLLIVVVVNVVLRYVFSDPLSWSDEVSKQLMIWMGFMGASLALWEKQHMGIDMLVSRLPSNFHPPLRLVGHLAVLFFLIFLLWFGIIHTRIAGPRQTIAMLRIPMTYAFMAVPLSAALMLLYQLAMILEDLLRTVGLPKRIEPGGHEL